jgi:hypothetical protein
MAFCTKCGAAVGGAFCNQCGTPTNQASGQAMPMPPPAPRKGMHPLAWVGIILLCIFGLGAAGIFGFVLWVAHNPARAVRKMITATNPNMEVVGTDDDAGTITVRDRRTGKVVTMSFDQARQGKFRISADDGDGRTAQFQLGGEVHLPAWLPAYPGSDPRGVFSASGDSGREGGDAGAVTFHTDDSADRVFAFYEEKARGLDMTVEFNEHRRGSRTLEAKNEDHDRGFKVEVTERRHGSDVTLTYGRKL